MKLTKLTLLPLLCLVLLVPACKDDDGGSGSCNYNFDQTELFQNLADQVILPAYNTLKNRVDDLAAATTAFNGNPSEINLAILRSAWLSAYLSWQTAAPYEFGPAEEVFLRMSVNNFPLDTLAVQANLQSGTYNFDQPDAFDKGFPALDYLLYGTGLNDAAIVARFTGTDGSKYRDYLAAVVADIQERVNHTYNGWNSGYRETFTGNTGTAAGTSLSLIINGFNQNYELIKREKLGVPSGVLTLGFANPDKVEAYYSGESLALAIRALEASEDLYLGRSASGTNGAGLDDYLIAANALKGGVPLDQLIKDQFATAINTLKSVEAPLSETVQNDQQSVINAYNEVTKQLVNIKTDMPSVLCVSITYIDNPSDSD